MVTEHVKPKIEIAFVKRAFISRQDTEIITSAKPNGHKGMYGHCHLNGNNIIAIASLTDVSTSGRNECTSIFCSVKINNNISKQLSGPKLISNCRKLAPDLGNARSSG